MNGHISACFDEDGTRVCGFDEHPEAVGPEACSLDAAWAEAEAALPEGWVLAKVDRLSEDTDCDTSVLRAEWSAIVVSRQRDEWGKHEVTAWASGLTPAAALRSLAAKLRDAR